MSKYRDSLPPEQRPAYDAAIEQAAWVLHEALWDQAELANTRGPRAVAEAAYVPGGPSVEEIEAKYLQLVAEDRAACASAAAASAATRPAGTASR